MNASSELFIGLMSGTSADGVDAALLKIDDNQLQLLEFIEHPLPSKLKQQLTRLNHQDALSLRDLCQLEHEVAQQFINATQTLLSKAGKEASEVRAIGSHGQTLFHAPDIPMSLQVGHPAFIAKQCAIDTAADFRIDDLAMGGQGAPIAPAFHKVLFPSATPFYVVNIGGIANISYINPLASRQIGFDTGPGNALMDELCQTKFNQAYDLDGQIAASGKVDRSLLGQLLEHPYFQQPYPKSTGRETFNQNWLQQQLKTASIAPEDLMATLCELTAKSIALGILQIQDRPKDTLWVVGGGAYNASLLQRLQIYLPDMEIKSSLKQGINPNAIEAMMCAWLAKQRVDNRPVALSAITGATRDVVLGGLWSKD